MNKIIGTMKILSVAIVFTFFFLNLTFGQKCHVELRGIDSLIIKLAADYSKSVLSEKEGVVAVDFSKNKDTTFLVVWSFVNLSFLKDYPPSYYFMVDNRPVLIYTGFEDHATFPNEYLSSLNSVCKKFLYNDLFKKKTKVDTLIQVSTPIAYHPSYWKVILLREVIVEMNKNFREGRLFSPN